MFSANSQQSHKTHLLATEEMLNTDGESKELQETGETNEAVEDTPTPEPAEKEACCDHEGEHDHSHDDQDEDADFIQSFKKLGSDLELMIRSIKPTVIVRDIRLVAPRVFNRNFRGFRPEKIGRGRMVRVLSKEILIEENIRVAQLVSLLWNHANQNIYKSMKDLVRTINPDVEKVEHIDDAKATEFVEALEAQGFKRHDIHICVRLNGVRFDQSFTDGRLVPPAEG